MEKRITPEEIGKDLPIDTVFVFGSNESGIHGAGAARLAFDEFGAYAGQGFGFMGQSFAIPTKSWGIGRLGLSDVEFYVSRFVTFAQLKENKDVKFLVTRIGCGLAGFTPKQIAPMFRECLDMENVWLPADFIEIIEASKPVPHGNVSTEA